MENHLITIDNRQKISITEVADIDNFDEEEICANLKEGGLTIKGKGLHIQKLDLAEGTVIITGEITALNYTHREKQGGKGLLKKDSEMNIQVTELIREQSYECLIMFCSGIAFMIAYEFCSFLSHKINLNKVWRIGLELLFWAASAIMVSEFLYYCAYGKLSVHSIGAFAAGLLLWKFGFYGIIYPNIHTKTKIKGLKKIHGEKKKKPRV